MCDSAKSVRRAGSKFLELCAESGVSPVVIGGAALLIHGIPRRLNDLDVLAETTGAQLGSLRTSVKRAGGRIHAVSELLREGGQRHVRFFLQGLQVDLLRPWDARSRKTVSRATMGSWLGLDVRVVKLADAVVGQAQAGRWADISRAWALISKKLPESECRRLVEELHTLGYTSWATPNWSTKRGRDTHIPARIPFL